MTVIYVKFSQSDSGVGASLTGFNNFFSTSQGAGVISPDLLDENGASTGITLSEGAQPFTLSAQSLAYSDQSPDPRLPVEFFQAAWAGTANGEKFLLGGFSPGQPYTIELSGQNSNGRDAVFSGTNSNPTSTTYDVQPDPDPDPYIASQPVVLSGTADVNGNVSISTTFVSVASYCNGFILTYDPGPAGPSITAADDVTTEGQTATFTLAGNTAPPTGATLNGTDVGALTLVSGGTYSYTAPLLLDDDTASLVVTVDSTTVSATISYANSYPYVLTQHGTPNVNSIFKDTQFASNDPVEWGVVTDYDSAIVTVDHAAMDTAEDELNDVSLHSTEVSEGTTTATYKYFVQESGVTGTWQATIVVSGEGGDNGGGNSDLPFNPLNPIGSKRDKVRKRIRLSEGSPYRLKKGGLRRRR